MGENKLRLLDVPIYELEPYANNARVHSDEQIQQIAASIREFGFLTPVLINSKKQITCGHGRVKAAELLRIESIPCIMEDHLTEKQRRAFILADNKIAENASWDMSLVETEIADLKLHGFDISLTGFDEWLSDPFDDEIDAEDDNFDVNADMQNPTFSKLGDVWTLGRHRLVCGDATKNETYETLMGDTKANLIITDPPYNVNYEGHAGKIKNDNMSANEFYAFLMDAFTCMYRALADDGSIYCFYSTSESGSFHETFASAGFHLSAVCVWVKNHFSLGHSDYQQKFEPILYGWKRGGTHRWFAGREETTVWNFDRQQKNSLHPTMKPIPLIAYPIRNSSMRNDVVLDPFGGSGSTLIACEQTGRICYTAEIDEKFCDVIVKRYIEQVGTDANVRVLRGGRQYAFGELVFEDR